jgi:hypothetical protein
LASSAIPAEWTVTQSDLEGGHYQETHRTTRIFALKDGRFYIEGTIALPTLDLARATIDELAKPRN